MLLKDRFAVNGRLQRLGLLTGEENVCLICGEDKEKSQNLFVHCSKIYKLSGRMSKLWDLKFVEAGDMGTSFDI